MHTLACVVLKGLNAYISLRGAEGVKRIYISLRGAEGVKRMH